jgi:hypothetical protein
MGLIFNFDMRFFHWEIEFVDRMPVEFLSGPFLKIRVTSFFIFPSS